MPANTRRLLLISMPIADLRGGDAQRYLFDTRAIVNTPYGLLSICTYLDHRSKTPVSCRILDVNDLLVTEYRQGNMISDCLDYVQRRVEEAVRQFEPDVVGLSVMFNIGYLLLDRLAAGIKRVRPDAVVVVGGNLATVLHDEIARKENVDAVNYGEGELSMLRLLESEDLRAHLCSDASFVTRASLEEGRKPVNSFVANLDDIPPIDYRYVSSANFDLPRIKKGVVYKKEFSSEMVSRIVYLSRGCPYGCNFCAGFNVHGKKVRSVSIARAVSDVRALVEKERLTDLFVCDDAFLIDKARAKTLLRAFVDLKLRVTLPSILMRNIDDEVAELLAKLGNTFQYTSLESGSDFVLKHIIRKPISKDEALRAVISLRKHGVSALTNIVVGSPEETDAHRQETLQTLRDIGFDWVYFMIALPLPGSRLYKQCKEKGYLVDENFYSPSLTKCNIRTPEYSPEHIEKQAYMMNLDANFVHNYNLRIGNYEAAMTSFRNVLAIYPDHAFAHYFLAKAQAGAGDAASAAESRGKFAEIVAREPYWKDWADQFGL